MIFISNSQAFVQSTSLPESFKLKLFSSKILVCAAKLVGLSHGGVQVVSLKENLMVTSNMSYRGTSLVRNRHPVGPYCRPMARVPGRS